MMFCNITLTICTTESFFSTVVYLDNFSLEHTIVCLPPGNNDYNLLMSTHTTISKDIYGTVGIYTFENLMTVK